MLTMLAVLLVIGGRWFWRQVQFTLLRVPLIKAVEAGDTDRVRELLEQGADPDVCMDYHPEPFTWRSVLQILKGEKQTPLPPGETLLISAAKWERVGIMQLLLERGAQVDTRDENTNYSAMTYASLNAQLSAMKVLLDHGADPNARDRNGYHELHAALRFDDAKPARLLLAYGAHPNVQSKDGWTPLMYAALFSGPVAVRMLLEAGANVNQSNSDGKTVLREVIDHLHEYQQEGYGVEDRPASFTTIRLLLDHGADITHKDKTGKTIWQTAIAYRDPEVIGLFRKAATGGYGAGKTAGR